MTESKLEKAYFLNKEIKKMDEKIIKTKELIELLKKNKNCDISIKVPAPDSIIENIGYNYCSSDTITPSIMFETDNVIDLLRSSLDKYEILQTELKNMFINL